MVREEYECLDCQTIYREYPEYGRCENCDGRVVLTDNIENDWDDNDY